MSILVLLVLIFIVIKTTLDTQYNQYKKYNKENGYINVFTYWEGPKHIYIEMCFKTMKKNLKQCKIHFLNDKNINEYLPELPKTIKRLPIYQQSDIIRVYLLHKYGGVWIDADTVILKDCRLLFDTDKYDFIGFGNSYLKSQNGYPKPSNGVMCSRKNGVLISRVKNKLDKMIYNLRSNNEYSYFDLGKKVIWESINELQKEQNYKYFHHNSSIDGTRDKNSNWINTKHHISNTFKFTDLLNYKDTHFIMLGNNELSKTNIKYLSEKDILNGDIFLSEIFKIAYN